MSHGARILGQCDELAATPCDERRQRRFAASIAAQGIEPHFREHFDADATTAVR